MAAFQLTTYDRIWVFTEAVEPVVTLDRELVRTTDCDDVFRAVARARKHAL